MFKTQYHEIAKSMLEYSFKSRNEGILALTEIIENLKGKRNFIKIGLSLIIDGIDKDFIEKILDNLINQETNKTKILLKTRYLMSRSNSFFNLSIT